MQTQAPPSARWLTTEEAAAYLGVGSAATLANWRSRAVPHSPRFHKIGSSVKYMISELDAYLASRSFTSTAEAQDAAA